jgi:5-hydroxyisourate hydrolase-like protein (transthyretin family)
MKYGIFRKILAFEIVGLLLILSIAPVFNSGFNLNTEDVEKRNIAEENYLAEKISEHEDFSQRLLGEEKGKTHGIKNSDENFSCRQRSDIVWAIGDLSDLHQTVYPSFYAMGADNDQSRGHPSDYHRRTNLPSKDSIICGYITDNTTSEPIEGAHVIVFLTGGPEIDVNRTYSDSSGFYNLSIETEVIFVVFRATGYFTEYMNIDDIVENETLWINVSLDPGASPRDSVVHGYVTDNITGAPIEDATVILFNADTNLSYLDYNYSYTDSSGYYTMNAAAGILAFYVTADRYFIKSTYSYNIGEYETLQIDISLYPKPPESSVVHGYVTNEITGDPIENAYVDLDWWDDQGRNYGNYTCTDPSGHYSGYYSKSTEEYSIGEGETLQVDISLYPKPPESSVVHGYVTNEITGNPIENAYVSLDWEDDMGHDDWNSTYTDPSGHYSMNVASGTIDLYFSADRYYSNSTDDYNIGEGEILQVDISLYPYPNENSVVCGYITNVDSDEPIENASVDLRWKDDQGYYYWNYTDTDASGYYSMNVASGEIFLRAKADGYFSNYTDDFDIDEFVLLWVNISLDPHPPENSVVCGYVTDGNSGNPIEDAQVDLCWENDQRRYYWNYTDTDSSGYYSMNVAAGETYIYVKKEGYHEEYTFRNDVEENETLWINVSLQCVTIEINIVKPQKAIYVNNNRLIPFFTCFVIGDIVIEADINDFYWFDVDKVEFYIDDELKALDSSPPYTWMWTERTLIKHKHTLKVVVYDSTGNSACDEVVVWKFR